jgi:hypothetical protein
MQQTALESNTEVIPIVSSISDAISISCL